MSSNATTSMRAKRLDDVPDATGAVIWLVNMAEEHKLVYALAHADDGVMWGRFSGSAWAWSGDVFKSVSPPLNWDRLLDMRLFGSTAEVFVWREESGLKGRLITEEVGGEEKPLEYFDEPQLLWGYADRNSVVDTSGFALMREGSQGLVHAPPTEIATEGRIWNRNYIGYDPDNCADVKASRLMTAKQ